MEFYDVVNSRTSIKKYKQAGINDEKLGRIIKAAMMSPSWKNRTPYKFIIVEDRNKKDQIASSIKNSSQEILDGVKDAPVVAVIVGEPGNSETIDGKDMYLMDSTVAMEHFVLAAANENYGTCWVACFDENAIKSILGIPAEFKVIALTPVGEIAESKPHNPPKDYDDHIYLDAWNKPYSAEKSIVMV